MQGRPAAAAPGARGARGLLRLAVLAVLLALLGSAGALTLSTARPRGIKAPQTTPRPVRTTPKYMRDFEDGKMDEEDSDPVINPLPVENQKAPPTKAPKPPKPKTTAAPPEPDANTALYRLLDSRGNACLLFKVDAVIIFKFKTVHEEYDEKDVYVPNNANVDGDCGSGDDARLVISWSDFQWTTYFTKTPGGERWYIEKSELGIDTGNTKVFEHIKNPGRKFRLTSGSSNLFATPVGKSYSCSDGEKAVNMTSRDTDIYVQLLLRDIRVQPFIFKNGEFGEEFVCSPGGVPFRDETAPIAVGSTLAIVVLCTITGYGAFRYFKIKKVQYDTME